MNQDPRPGRTARLAREVAAQRRLLAPAPIGWDPAALDPGPLARAEAAISAQQAVVERETRIHAPQAPQQRAGEPQEAWRSELPPGWTAGPWINVAHVASSVLLVPAGRGYRWMEPSGLIRESLDFDLVALADYSLYRSHFAPAGFLCVLYPPGFAAAPSGAARAVDDSFDGRPVRDAEDSASVRDPRDLTGGATDHPQARAAAPIDWTRVQIGADEWTGWIDWPGGEVCPIPLARAKEFAVRWAEGSTCEPSPTDADNLDWTNTSTDFDITAIRLRARPASDTEGLLVGAVVRVWWDRMHIPEVPRYAQWRGIGWAGAHWSVADALRLGHVGDWASPVHYLPVNLAEGGAA